MSGRDVLSPMSIQAERVRLLDFLTHNPQGVCSAVKEVVRDIMLSTDGRLTVAGRLFDIKAKQLGGGVYRLNLVEVKS